MSLLFLPGLILAAGAAVGLVLWRLGALTSPSAVAWNRVGRNHGLIDERPLTERLGQRAPFLRRFDDVANVPRLLAIAGRTESALAWVLRNVALALLVLLAGLSVALGILATSHTLPLPIVYFVLLAVVAFVVGYLRLRIGARRRQAGLQAGLSGALTE